MLRGDAAAEDHPLLRILVPDEASPLRAQVHDAPAGGIAGCPDIPPGAYRFRTSVVCRPRRRHCRVPYIASQGADDPGHRNSPGINDADAADMIEKGAA